ncbi:uncharacterized protein BDW47DRAFT_97114 [Aspergillus candidus]|uniref:Uncharacterized protein n=1 Tax=Aspergillus candidus TaxID=41067 RepID=A0A2I2FP69_ASPCN|nr:hypothetical protein BDW47DRAFT_97114 [Aspergillus candidus]PLB42426.1 hypothetical protein BDW47DRAFT_97114 [Aspergillus candidus]
MRGEEGALRWTVRFEKIFLVSFSSGLLGSWGVFLDWVSLGLLILGCIWGVSWIWI